VSQEVGNIVGVLGLGTTGHNFSSAMFHYLNEKISPILISLDNDEAGRQKTESLMKDLQRSIDWAVPTKYGKDIGESWKYIDLKNWIRAGLDM